MKTIAEMREDYRARTGRCVRSYKAYPIVGRGSIVHDWVSHDDANRCLDRARSVGLFTRLAWLLGGLAWK